MLNFFGFGRTTRIGARRTSKKRAGARPRLEVERLEERQVMSAATLWDIGGGVYDLAQTFQLSSTASAKHTIYLDFDGHTNGDVYGTGWDNIVSPAWDYSANGASFTTTEQQIIQKIWARVAEDYAPFNVNVTTQDPGVEALRKVGTTDDRWGIRVVFTGNDQPAPGSGGVAYITSFNFSTDTPVYVFNVGEKGAAEAATHEAGHSLGLGHDGTATLGYYGGHGSGVTSWGPIMGASYNPNVTQWSKGEYAGANNLEDDLTKITTQNGFGYRSDDYGSTQASAFSLLPQGSSAVSATYGIIERNTDADYFSFWSNAGTIALNVDPTTLGPNLAVRADLYDAAGTLLTTVNPVGALNASVSFTLPTAGQYFLKVIGTGKGDPLTTGFTNYASLGNYRITGTVQAYTGGSTGNVGPVAIADNATTVVNTPVTVNVLANDSDANGDALTITSVSSFVNGSAVISGNSVVFTPNAGFTGTGSFTYSISDGHGGSASATASVTVNPGNTQKSFTNDANVTISSRVASTVTSSINVAGLSGTLQDVDVKVNILHTYVSDLRLTLIAPDGTRIILFNRHGGSGDNLVNTTFDSAASVGIASSAAPFTGSFRPYASLSALNGKSPNGRWKLEVRDNYRLDGGFLDNWTLSVRVGAAGTVSRTESSDRGPDHGNREVTEVAVGNAFQSVGTTALPARVYEFVQTNRPGLETNAPKPPAPGSAANTAHLKAIAQWLASNAPRNGVTFELEGDLPAWNW